MVRSLAPVNSTTFTVSTDRKWVYFESATTSRGIYRVPYAGGAATKVSGAAEISQLRVSPDGSRLAWEVMAGNRPALRVRDLARGSEQVLPLPGPLAGPGSSAAATGPGAPTAASSRYRWCTGSRAATRSC